MKIQWKILGLVNRFGREDKSRISIMLENELPPPPRVCIGLETMKKIQSFVAVAGGEINGMGVVEKIGNDFLIRDAFILEQNAGAAHAEIDPMALNRLVAECPDYDKLRFQWHSHVHMPAIFSGVDTATIAEYAGYFGDFMISLVANKRGEYSCRLDLFRPFYAGFEVPLTVMVRLDRDMMKSCREEAADKVRGGAIERFFEDDEEYEEMDREVFRGSAAVSLEDLSFESEQGE